MHDDLKHVKNKIEAWEHWNNHGKKEGRIYISLKNETISSHHAEIQRRRTGDVFIVDLASANGVFVNENKITQMQLISGDVIELGEVRLRFESI
jgi:hypothetical protein